MGSRRRRVVKTVHDHCMASALYPSEHVTQEFCPFAGEPASCRSSRRSPQSGGWIGGTPYPAALLQRLCWRFLVCPGCVRRPSRGCSPRGVGAVAGDNYLHARICCRGGVSAFLGGGGWPGSGSAHECAWRTRAWGVCHSGVALLMPSRPPRRICFAQKRRSVRLQRGQLDDPSVYALREGSGSR